MSKKPVTLKETATGVHAVRGLGSVTGSPAGVTDHVANYINTNAMSYQDDNGDKLKYMNQSHFNLHAPGSQSYGAHTFNPTSQNSRLSANINVKVKRKKKKLNEMGEYDNRGGTVGAEGLTDPHPNILRKNDMKENDLKGSCWKGYTAKGLKKKGDRMVPNCVPVKEQGVGIRSYTEKPLVEKKPIPDSMPTGSDRGIYQEGWASIGNPYDRFGDVNRKAKFYGKKPKATTTKSDEKDDTYKGSKKGGNVKFAKTPSKEKLEEVSAKLVGKVHNRYLEKGKAPPAFVQRAVKKKWLESKVGKVPEKKKHVKEDAVTVAATQHMDTAQSGYQQAAKRSASRVNLRGNTAHVKGAEYRSGTGSARASLGTGGQMKPTSTNVPTRFMRSVKNAPTTQGAGGQLKPSSTSGSSSFTPNSQSRSMNVGKGMAASKQTSPVVKGMSAAGQEASKKIVPKAAGVLGTVGKAARALSGPEGAAVTAAAEPLAKKMASSYKAGHQSFTPHGGEGEKASTVFARMKQPSQGRSVSQYEKDVLTPKASEAPKAPENPKVDAPTPPSRPDYFSRGQAFGAARKEAGGGEGKFSYDNKSFQTNVSGEKYKPSSQLKQTSVQEDNTELSTDDIAKRRQAADSTATKDVFNRMRTGTPKGVINLDRNAKVDEQTPSHLHLNKPDTKYAPGAAGTTHTIHEETKMDSKEHINEALDNILEDNLSEMKDHLLIALQEKAMEKLEERKKEIAANYFAQ
jgi:hypothetical protein